MAAIIYSAVCAKCESHTGYSHTPITDGFVCSRCLSLKVEAPRAPSIPRAVQKRIDKVWPRSPKPLVSDFTPNGRSGLYIYAVVVKQHPDKVKIGMTRKWVNRRRSYANWDLSAGDAILEERVFCINEEFVDLEKLEAHILDTFDARRAFGAEWFFETIDEAARHIDRVMCANGISYDL